MGHEPIQVTAGDLKQLLINIENSLREVHNLDALVPIIQALHEFNECLIIDPPVGAMDARYIRPSPWPPIDSCGAGR